MNNKFNVGDRVKIIGDIYFKDSDNIGKTGIIVNKHNDNRVSMLYRVEFDTGGGFIFVDDEMELVNNE